ncbi:hypothetical protein KKH15_01200 [Patescibacteria group bacterium]|nr:hypothetical protein [Patescibacteria group bacterium]MBU1754687.1 hypothetical protein [Patescibacteria group bacterium]
MRWDNEIREKAVALRKRGFMYQEIRNELGLEIPKTTMYLWFKEIVLSKQAQKVIDAKLSASLANARQKSIDSKLNTRQRKQEERIKINESLTDELDSLAVQKITLATLYLGEGSKNERGSLVFANSNPGIIALFLRLLRSCFELDESKFRCTLQLRADQDAEKLSEMWKEITSIPSSQFYKTRIDPRSIGKPSQKPEYKGVCRIDYISHDLLCELLAIGTILTRARSSAG